MPRHKSLKPFIAELCKTSLCFFKCFLTVRVSLGIELVGIANNLFFQCHWQEVLMWQRKMLFDYFFLCQASACMPFTDTHVRFHVTYCHHVDLCFLYETSIIIQQICTNDAVADVWLFAEALYAGRITTTDADVMKHGGCFQKVWIHSHFGMGCTNLQCPLGDHRRMRNQNIPKLVGFGIIIINYFVVVHI